MGRSKIFQNAETYLKPNMSNLKTSGKTRPYVKLLVEIKIISTTILRQKKTFA